MDKSRHIYDNRSADRQFLRMVRSHQDSIYAFVFTLVHNDADAEDITQETLAIMWQKFSSYQNGTSFVAWGISIAKILVLRLHEKKIKDKRLFSPELQRLLVEKVSPYIPQQDERVYYLRQCLKKLNNRDHTIIEKRYVHKMSAKRIAQETKVELRSLYRVLNRIHSSLMSCIERSMTHGGSIG
jgi:RNA polymerase sigma-70 factor (ECF subfamily)